MTNINQLKNKWNELNEKAYNLVDKLAPVYVDLTDVEDDLGNMEVVDAILGKKYMIVRDGRYNFVVPIQYSNLPFFLGNVVLYDDLAGTLFVDCLSVLDNPIMTDDFWIFYEVQNGDIPPTEFNYETVEIELDELEKELDKYIQEANQVRELTDLIEDIA